YWLWQIKAYLLARKLHKKFNFYLAHQITFNNDWMPNYIGAYLQIPFIWGPAGGGQKVPAVLGRELPLRVRINEIARNLLQEFWRHTPTRIIGMKKAKAVLVCNDETRKKVEKFSNRIYNFPVNGISREDLVQRQEPKLGFRDSDLEFSFQANRPNSKTDQPTNTPTDQQLFRVIFAGRFDPIKGIPLGIKAFSLFHKKYPDSIFEIIGEGPDEDRIKDIIRKLNLDNSINLIPWLIRERLLDKMQKSDVLLFPSFRDGGGAVVIEAMASGIPVICLDLAGPALHINKKCGVKIKPKSSDYIVNEMAKALELLYLNESLRVEMGKRGRKMVEENHTPEKHLRRIIEIYELVIRNG
ncbi:glycosyltransferase family 4 protein, partial [bacterium]|nr:glycosyltransferase family 4 protein [bacterium]